MKIPEVRERLLDIAAALEIEGCGDHAEAIRGLVRELYRRPPVRRAPRQARPLSAQERERAREIAAAHPDMPQRDIARVFGVDGGRVSEAVAGKRP